MCQFLLIPSPEFSNGLLYGESLSGKNETMSVDIERFQACINTGMLSQTLKSIVRLLHLTADLPLTMQLIPLINTSLYLAFQINAVPLSNEKRQPQNVYLQGASDAVVLDLPTALPTPPPDASGSLYGTEALLGYDGYPVEGSAIVEDVKLVPGQLADPIEGLELDLELIKKPQPVRGTDGLSGATDPGPGNASHILLPLRALFLIFFIIQKIPAATTASIAMSSPPPEPIPGTCPMRNGP